MEKSCSRCNKKKNSALFEDKWGKETKTCKPCRDWRLDYMMKKGYMKGTGYKVVEHKFLDGEEFKKCSKCKIFQALETFSKSKTKSDGLRSQCKICVKAGKQTEDEKIKTAARNKKYYQEHSEQLKQKSSEWYQNNKEKSLERSYAYNKKRRLIDPSFRVSRNLRCRLHNALRSQRALKSGLSFDLIGCSLSFFMKYLEEKFDSEMTWGNYGQDGWHIDHIKPCSKFNLLDEEEQKLCFHYLNLQPLWGDDNIIKSDNWTDEQDVEWKEITMKGREIIFDGENYEMFSLEKFHNTV